MTPMDAAMAAMDRPWRWGEADCCASACRAFAALWGCDPMLPLRDAYHDAAGARALIAQAGGLGALAARIAAESGLVETDAPRPGDIGLVATPALALCIAPGRWVAKTTRGLALLPRAERAWTWPR